MVSLCPTRPVVTVIIPPAPGRRHPADLLLCGHHFRVSQAALTTAGAAVYDDMGAQITVGPLGDGGRMTVLGEPPGDSGWGGTTDRSV